MKRAGQMREWIGFGLTLGAVALAGQAWAQGTTPGADKGWDLAGTGATALGVLGFGLSLYNTWSANQKDKKKTTADGAYLAIQLISILESFAKDCSNLIGENNQVRDDRSHEMPEWKTRLPYLGAYPDDPEGFKAIDRNIVAECMAFKREIITSQEAVTYNANEDWVSADISVDREAFTLGLKAHELALKLGSHYGLPNAEYHYVDHLRRKKDAVEKREAGAISVL